MNTDKPKRKKISFFKNEEGLLEHFEGFERGENVYTVQELASYLRMKPLTIYKHASGGKLPGFKVGSHWRFKKATIDQWIQSQEITNSNKNSYEVRS